MSERPDSDIDTCMRKRPYPTMKQANRAVRGRLMSEGENFYLRVYQCPACGMFHLTSQKPEEVKRP